MNAWICRFRSFGVVPLFLFVTLGLPSLIEVVHSILPRSLTLLLFFAPQYLFFFTSVVRPTIGGFSPLFSPTLALLFGLAVWASTSVGYGFTTMKWRWYFQLLAAPFTIFFVAALLHITFSIFGFSIQLDGP